jgi:hypothetical protein
MGSLRSVLLIFFLAFMGGCASSPTPAAVGLTPPSSNFDITGKIYVNLPPPLSLKTGLPPNLIAKLHAEAHSSALPTTCPSSHHDGQMTLVITDQSGQQIFANIDFAVHGDSEGTPTQGLGDAISRFFDAASLMSQPLNNLRAQSH